MNFSGTGCCAAREDSTGHRLRRCSVDVGVVDYSNRVYPAESFHAVTHSGDQIDGARREGVHSIDLRLRSLRRTQCMFFTMSAWAGAKLRDIRQPHVRLYDKASGHELCRYNFCDTERSATVAYGDSSCVIMCKVWRRDQNKPWEVEALGQLCNGAADNYDPIRVAVERMLPPRS